MPHNVIIDMNYLGSGLFDGVVVALLRLMKPSMNSNPH